ncbi:MAG: ABC transporter ATP-binding protein [Ruminococcaceae bacterium]|nr:ABC transporter ATP-binding protein [Oscillospiraceae bacterium]
MKRDNTSRGSLSKIGKRLLRHPMLLVISLLCAVVYVAATLYTPRLTGQAIDLIVDKGNVDLGGVTRLLIVFGIAVAVSAVLQWIMGVCTGKVAYLTVRDIRKEAFEKLENLPVGYIDSHSRGDILNRIMSDTEQIESGLVMSIQSLVTGVLTVVSIIVILFLESLSVASVVLLVTPLSLFVATFIAKKSFAYFREQSRTRGEITGLIDEAVGYQRTIRANGAEAAFAEKFEKLNDETKKASLRAVFVSSMTNPSTRLINNIVFAGVALTGALSVAAGSISVGDLSCFLSYTNQYTKPFNEITGILSELQNAAACATRVFELLDENEQSPEHEDALVLSPEEISGEVRFEDVSFSYVPERPLIEDMTLAVKPGQKVAIVGPTGCGKTTLINLLMRFYDVNDGAILVDGTDIREITRQSLRGSFGMVLQGTWIKKGTVRENIAMGKPEASDDEIIEAAKASHAHSFIKRLPSGYDTVIGDDDGLSEGQRQLLCIARVMLRRPPMLILDEATSSIDTRTEIVVQDAFLRLMEGRTAFIVAHRLSTIKEADVILVMKDGHIIETGTHKELLENGGFYKHLYESQFVRTSDSEN